jgi:hypothetical protein
LGIGQDDSIDYVNHSLDVGQIGDNNIGSTVYVIPSIDIRYNIQWVKFKKMDSIINSPGDIL